MKKFGVLGYPVKHSKSPVIFTFLKNKFDLDFSYHALEIQPEEFSQSLDMLLSFDGLNITSPYKNKILEYCKGASPEVQTLRAANVVVKSQTDFYAHNTDIYGFMESLRDFDLRGKSALVFGSSGGARAVLMGLSQLGVDNISVKARRYDDLADLSFKEFDVAECTPNIVINATTIGLGKESLATEHKEFFTADYTKTQIAYDLIYHPAETPFLKFTKENQIPHAVNGLNMLVFQAVKAFEIWFDIKVENMRPLVAELKEIL